MSMPLILLAIIENCSFIIRGGGGRERMLSGEIGRVNPNGITLSK